MIAGEPPYHAHIYYGVGQRPIAEALRQEFLGRLAADGDQRLEFVGMLADRPIGPHPMPQYEVHFLESSLPAVIAAIERSGLTALVHPLTDDDFADHTALAYWLGEPLDLDLTVLDPPGKNQGIERFGKSDF